MTIETVIICDCCKKNVDQAVHLDLEGASYITALHADPVPLEPIELLDRHYCHVCWKGRIRTALNGLGVEAKEWPAEEKAEE